MKKDAKEDLSRYTIDSSGSAPAQREQEESTSKKKIPTPAAKEEKKEVDPPAEKLEDKVDVVEVPLETQNKRLYYLGIGIFIGIFGATGTLFYFRASLLDNEVEEIVQEETEEVAQEAQELVVEATPSPLQREELSLEILNGSGVTGAAGDIAAVFEKLGYIILEVGNADEQIGNTILLNAEVKELAEVLLVDVEKELGIASSSGELEDSTASARIILGVDTE